LHGLSRAQSTPAVAVLMDEDDAAIFGDLRELAHSVDDALPPFGDRKRGLRVRVAHATDEARSEPLHAGDVADELVSIDGEVGVDRAPPVGEPRRKARYFEPRAPHAVGDAIERAVV